MALAFIIALTALVYLKPQEFVPILQALPLVHIMFVLAAAGVALDIGRGKLSAKLPPQWNYVLGFAIWSILVIIVREHSALGRIATLVGVGAGMFFVVAMGMATPARVWTFASVLLALGLFLAAVGAMQSTAPFACYSIQRVEDSDEPEYDGRPCETYRDCEKDTNRTDVDWLCERPGPFGTSSIGHGRVRYRGSLSDPNELALVIGTALPFAFALREKKRSFFRLIGLIAAIAVAGWCVIRTESRGGQIVFLTVVGLYFLRKFRLWGAIMGPVVALPVLLLGGRAGAEADASALERVEAWYEGITFFKETPIIGIGPNQFVDRYYLTAHNAYLLVAAETGAVGFLLWSLALYGSVKIPWVIWRDRGERLPGGLSAIAPALVVAFIGMFIGIFFLSFSYKEVLFLFMGLAGALALAAKRSRPDFDFRVSGKEALIVGVIDAALLVTLFVYTRLKVG